MGVRDWNTFSVFPLTGDTSPESSLCDGPQLYVAVDLTQLTHPDYSALPLGTLRNTDPPDHQYANSERIFECELLGAFPETRART